MSGIEFIFLLLWAYSIITYKAAYRDIKGKKLAHNYNLYSYFISLNGVILGGIIWFFIEFLSWIL